MRGRAHEKWTSSGALLQGGDIFLSKNDFIQVLGTNALTVVLRRGNFGCVAVTVLGWRLGAYVLERKSSLRYDGLRERYINRTVRRATIWLEDFGYASLPVPRITS